MEWGAKILLTKVFAIILPNALDASEGDAFSDNMNSINSVAAPSPDLRPAKALSEAHFMGVHVSGAKRLGFRTFEWDGHTKGEAAADALFRCNADSSPLQGSLLSDFAHQITG